MPAAATKTQTQSSQMSPIEKNLMVRRTAKAPVVPTWRIA